MRISDWSSDVCSSDLWRTAEWVSTNPEAKGGSLTLSGDWNLFESRGLVNIDLYRYPLLQRSDRYAMVSGKLVLDAALPRIAIKGALTADAGWFDRSEEHTSELQSLMRISYAVFCLKKKKKKR